MSLRFSVFYRGLLLLLVFTLAGCAQLSLPESATQHSGQAPDRVQSQYSSMTSLLLDRNLGQGNFNNALDDDLWLRIRRGYAMPNLDTPLAERQTNWYAQRPEYIGRMSNRSRRYLYYIVEEIERRNMPTELALLPFIESAFNPQAHSSAKASGIWQFIPSTGRYFSLKQNSFHDDRRDIQASTKAALDYLEKLYGMFGDWHLALAAYNWGEGSVQRAIRRNKEAGLGTSYTDLNMPAETANYVPKLQAIKNIVSQPAQYGIDLPYVPNHPFFRAVNIQRDMDVSVAAQLAEIGVESFKELNPSSNKGLIVASHTPSILLPWDKADVFERNLRNYRGMLASHTAWVVPNTMSLAAAAEHIGTDESSLRNLNNISGNRLIRSGSTLLIERSSPHADEDISLDIAQGARLDLTPIPKPAPVVTTREVCTGKGKKRRCRTVTESAKRDTAPSKAKAGRQAKASAKKAGPAKASAKKTAAKKAAPASTSKAAPKKATSKKKR